MLSGLFESVSPLGMQSTCCFPRVDVSNDENERFTVVKGPI